MSTRQSTPGPSNEVLQPQNAKKRSSTEECDDIRDAKKVKKGATADRDSTGKDKKRRRKRKRKTSIVIAEPISRTHSKRQNSVSEFPLSSNQSMEPSTSTADKEDKDEAPSIPLDKGKGKAAEDPPEPSPNVLPSTETPHDHIARLTQELEAQSTLLQKHQTTLTQLHQSLTCQICLDLLHKPFALAPCGHIACYPCLVRWFSAEPGARPQPPKKKTCPICRVVVLERPVEVWGVKSMVGSLVKSGLITLPAPLEATENANTNPDPWHGIFRGSRAVYQQPNAHGMGPHPPNENRIADFGMYDAEDGGVYRCIDCMHEIWAGVCTGCHREYNGHMERLGADDVRRVMDGWGIDDSDEDDEDSDEWMGQMNEDDVAFVLDHMMRPPRGGLQGDEIANVLRMRYPRLYGDISDSEDEDEAHIEGRDLAALGIVDDDDDDDGYESSFIDDGNEGQGQHRGRAPHVVELLESDDEVEVRPRAVPRIRRAAVARSDPIVISDGDSDVEAPNELARRIGRSVRLGSRRQEDERGPHNSQRRHQPAIILDSDEESSAESEVRVAGRNRRVVVIAESDEESDAHGEIARTPGVITDEEALDPISSDVDAQQRLDEEDERYMYGEDDSIPGPSSRLRRMMGGDSEEEDEYGYQPHWDDHDDIDEDEDVDIDDDMMYGGDDY